MIDVVIPSIRTFDWAPSIVLLAGLVNAHFI
jgi:hypothetical protein